VLGAGVLGAGVLGAGVLGAGVLGAGPGAARTRMQPRANAPPTRVGNWPMATSMKVVRAKYQDAAGRRPTERTRRRSKHAAEAIADRAVSGQSPRYPPARGNTRL
jgi:hypothetical protein